MARQCNLKRDHFFNCKKVTFLNENRTKYIVPLQKIQIEDNAYIVYSKCFTWKYNTYVGTIACLFTFEF